MRAADREQAIIEEAVRFFAEHGFEGQTRELAKRMGITHSAIYRYIPSKEALIERVYEHVYLSRWKADWATLVTDRSRPLEARLTQFYLEYVEQVFDYHWVRIFAFSGLKSFDITSRYLTIVRDEIILPACAELRVELKLPTTGEIPVGEREAELSGACTDAFSTSPSAATCTEPRRRTTLVPSCGTRFAPSGPGLRPC